MAIFDIVVLLAALCGVVMVTGGLYLLAKGAITLASTPKSDALTVEWRKQFRITTQIPGIGFFLVGGIFLGGALAASKPPEVAPIELQGAVEGVATPVTVFVRPPQWTLVTTSDGEFHGRIYPDIAILFLEATAPGYLPKVTEVSITDGWSRTANVGSVRLQKQIDEIPPKPENIVEPPFEAPAIGLNGSDFGVPR